MPSAISSDMKLKNAILNCSGFLLAMLAYFVFIRFIASVPNLKIINLSGEQKKVVFRYCGDQVSADCAEIVLSNKLEPNAAEEYLVPISVIGKVVVHGSDMQESEEVYIPMLERFVIKIENRSVHFTRAGIILPFQSIL
jgi:hypothetical protein